MHIFTTYKRIWEKNDWNLANQRPKLHIILGVLTYEDGCMRISFVNLLMSELWKLFLKNKTIVIFFRSLASFPPWQKSTAGMMACALFHQQNTRWVIKSNKSVLVSFIILSNMQDSILTFSCIILLVYILYLKNWISNLNLERIEGPSMKVLGCKFCFTSNKFKKIID